MYIKSGKKSLSNKNLSLFSELRAASSVTRDDSVSLEVMGAALPSRASGAWGPDSLQVRPPPSPRLR